MPLLNRSLNWLRNLLRSFVLGPGVVQRSDMAFGKASEDFTPAEYGNYIAASNAVHACATLRAQLLSSLPLKLYRLNAQGEKTEVTTGQLFALLQKVNPFWTFNRLLEMTELSLCLWGEAFWFLERGESGRLPPREIWWGRPDRVRVVPDPDQYIKGFLFQPLNSSTPIPFEPDEVIWFRYPNPIDEYEGLSPLAAARLAADYASAAMLSNRNLFAQGIQAGGALFPKAGSSLTPEQAEELELQLDRRFKGVDKAHRWGVFRFEAEMKSLGFTPKEAEFLGGLKWALEDVCRSYKVPLDLVGGQRTYENVDAAHKAVWTHCIIPEARFIATDLTEQLLPMFAGQADLAEFDSSEVSVLQADEGAEWMRAKEEIQTGSLLINEWREKKGLDSLPWGDAWWAPLTVAPIRDGKPPALPAPVETVEEESEELEEPRLLPAPQTRAIEYGSPEHERLWTRFATRTAKQEKEVSRVVVALFERQRDSVLSRLKGRSARTPEEAVKEPFNQAQWIKAFRQEARPVLSDIIQEAGNEALDEIGLSIAFDVLDPNVVRFLERRAQRFAREVNETTWSELKKSLAEGIKAGESIPALADRVEAVMAERIRSTPETIARTEVIGASNGGTLEAWKQTDVVEGKSWLAALDDRTRDTHVAAHGQTVGLDEDFQVGGCSGPAPGQTGCAEEDIQCRCTITAVLAEERLLTVFSGNGHGPARVQEPAASVVERMVGMEQLLVELRMELRRPDESNRLPTGWLEQVAESVAMRLAGERRPDYEVVGVEVTRRDQFNRVEQFRKLYADGRSVEYGVGRDAQGHWQGVKPVE